VLQNISIGNENQQHWYRSKKPLLIELNLKSIQSNLISRASSPAQRTI